MKVKITNLKFLAALFSLLFIFSCTKDNEEPQFDFETFKLEIQTNHDYIEYTKANEAFFQGMINKEIDLTSIINEFKNNDIQDYCSADPAMIDGITGSADFLNSYCKMKSNLNSLILNVNEITMLTEEQFIDLFKCDLSSLKNSNNEAQQRANCLQDFNNNLVVANFVCSTYIFEELCLDIALEVSVLIYVDCCVNGGSGC